MVRRGTCETKSVTRGRTWRLWGPYGVGRCPEGGGGGSLGTSYGKRVTPQETRWINFEVGGGWRRYRGKD